MGFRDDLAPVIARDPRYAIEAYQFVLQALDHTKLLRRQSGTRPAGGPGPGRPARGRPTRRPRTEHVTGQELCHGARDLALRQYGLLALTVLAQWGIRSTSDLGEIVYNLIASGDLEKTPEDARSDFDNVFDFAGAFFRGYTMINDEAA
jgi:uncharacterized repeat protein (TIGR04138 family)